jgi:phosphoglycerate dehydrogenase-like enzyme
MGCELVPLEQVLKRGDFVSIHVPLTAETQGLINKKTLGG